MCAKRIAVRRYNIVAASLAATSLFLASLSTTSYAAISASGDNTANPTAAGADPSIGVSDLGRLTITAGSVVNSDVVVVGDLATGIGLVTVTDYNAATAATSTWTTNSLMVGDAGTGRLEVLNGAIVTVDRVTTIGVGDLNVGFQANSIGTVIVDGLGSMIYVGDDTFIGGAGTGTLRIKNEGYVVATNSVAGDTDLFSVGALGRVELSNGRLRTELLTNSGMIVGSGRLDGTSTMWNNVSGHMEANAGDRLEVNAFLDNDGAIALKGGEMAFLKSVVNSNAGAEVTLRDGATARFPTSGLGFDSTAGVLASTAGTNDIYGTVRIQTTASNISVSGGSTAVFHDPVTNTGGTIEVFSGSTIVYLQGLTTTGSGSALAMTLADPDTGTGSKAIEVSGNASLAGNLKVNLESGFKPSAGDVFPILVAAGSVTGSLSLVGAPILAGGMQWDLDLNSSNVLLRVVATGDYNGNGVVDAGDYVVWRNSQNQTGDGLAADSNGDGIVNGTDYAFWRGRIGNVVSASLGAGSVVPEPAAMTLLLLGVALIFNGRRRV